MTLIGVTIEHSHGSGLAVEGEGGRAVVINSTIVDNATSRDGGGIYCELSGLTLINSTIARNSAGGHGEGVYGDGLDHVADCQLHMVNSIVAENTAPIGPEFSGLLTYISGGHNVIGMGGGVSAGPGDRVNVYAHLGPLGDYGGPTPTIPLVSAVPGVSLSGSPAIGNGDPAICAAALPAGAGGVDQRGEPCGPTHCDSGAVEVQLASLAVLPATILRTIRLGEAAPIYVAAKSEFGGVLPDYTGTVIFTSSDKGAKLPAPYTFTTGKGGDEGRHAVSFATPGKQTVTVMDAKGEVSDTETFLIVPQ